MKTFLFIIALLLSGSVAYSQACINVSTQCKGTDDYCYNCTASHCGPYELSKGIYRIPFENGTDVEITGDHYSHCPRGRIDMVGDDDHIVAAADGWIREIVDNNSEQCVCDDDTFCENNYIWMEHPNGEWTKYTHMQPNSVPSSVDDNDWVLAGTFLGLQGDVGCAGGVHLHFEVAQPIDTNTLVYDVVGGYIVSPWAKNVIPVICGITGNVFEDEESYEAADCPTGCSGFLLFVPITYSAGEYEVILNEDGIANSSDVTFESWSSGLFQAGNEITLKDGFHAFTNSDFTARIGDCDEFSPKTHEAESSLAFNSIKEIKIYPNPASGFSTVEFDLDHEAEVTIQLTDISGRIISSVSPKQTFQKGGHQFDINTQSLDGGTYLCVVEINQTKMVKKLVVQH